MSGKSYSFPDYLRKIDFGLPGNMISIMGADGLVKKLFLVGE